MLSLQVTIVLVAVALLAATLNLDVLLPGGRAARSMGEREDRHGRRPAIVTDPRVSVGRRAELSE